MYTICKKARDKALRFNHIFWGGGGGAVLVSQVKLSANITERPRSSSSWGLTSDFNSSPFPFQSKQTWWNFSGWYIATGWYMCIRLSCVLIPQTKPQLILLNEIPPNIWRNPSAHFHALCKLDQKKKNFKKWKCRVEEKRKTRDLSGKGCGA